MRMGYVDMPVLAHRWALTRCGCGVVDTTRLRLAIWQVIGSGHHGDVVIGTLRSTGRRVVMKQPKVDIHASADNVVKLFRHEAAAQAVLGMHPNVVEFLGIAEHSDASGPSTQLPSIVLEYVEHGSLDGLLAKRGYMGGGVHDDATKLRLCRDVAAGLSNVHSAGLTHNDISARNVLVGSGYVVR